MMRRRMLTAAGRSRDPFADSVVSLLHFDGPDGSTSIVDETGKAWAASGAAQLDTARSRFGGSSLELPSYGSSISTPYSADFAFDADFTVEFFIYVVSHQQYGGLVSCAESGSGWGGWAMIFSNTTNRISVEAEGGILMLSNGALPLSSCRHVELSRSGSTVRLFLDGQLDNSATNSAVFDSGSAPLRVGIERDTTFSIIGSVEELRITKGVARHTSNFTPPESPYPNP